MWNVENIPTNKCEFDIINEEEYTLRNWYHLVLHAMAFHYLAK